jgi:hypothetical protein
MRIHGIFTLVAVTAVAQSACYKGTSASADSVAASSTATTKSFDKNAASAQILANDSAFIRGMMAKNVDSVMCCYDNDAVSLGGGKAYKGLSDIRKSYVEAVKANVKDVNFHSDGVNFSDDGRQANETVRQLPQRVEERWRKVEDRRRDRLAGSVTD